MKPTELDDLVEEDDQDKPLSGIFVHGKDIRKYCICDRVGIPISNPLTNMEMTKDCKEVSYNIGEIVYCPLERFNKCPYRRSTK